MFRDYRPVGRLFALVLALALTGCRVSQPYPSQLPCWRDGLVVSHSAHGEAPAAGLYGAEGWLVIWAEGPALLARTVTITEVLSEPQTLITGRMPWAPILLPALEDEWHLLWRDLDDHGEARLYGAHLSAAGKLLRGPVAVTPEGISTYAAVPGEDGALILLWAQASLRPDIYGQRLDAQGRPDATPPALIIRSAEHPALARTAKGAWVMSWLAWPDAALRDSSSREMIITTSAAALPWHSSAPPRWW
jgi:hypothetical protein